jgi:hypothetical protein
MTTPPTCQGQRVKGFSALNVGDFGAYNTGQN